MRKSKWIVLLMVAVLAFSLVGCGSEPAEEPAGEESGDLEPVTLSLAFSAADASPTGLAAKELKAMIEEKSEGKITIDIYPDAQLGGDRELIEGAQNENIDIISMTTAPLVNFIPELAVFDMPMVFSDIETARAVMDGGYYQELEGMFETAGLKLLMANPDSFRQMSSNIPVYELADFDGIKIRTMENKYHMAFWEELGATPTPLAFGELYIALQQGLVHAQENPYATLIASKLNEQQDYVLDTNHIMFLNTTSINENVFNNLPEEYQNILTESFEEAREIAFEISREEDQKALDEVIEAGTEFIEVSDELRSEMQEAAQPVYEMIAEEIGQDSVDALFEAIEEVQ